MIITDKFVFVHDPKTGGSFVTSALFELYDVKWNYRSRVKLFLFKENRSQTKFGTFIQTALKHYGCRHIPPEHAGKKILATVRNPFDWYVSQYEFGWWKRRETSKYFKELPDFKRNYPEFPEIGFSEFLKLSDQTLEVNFDCQKEVWSQFGLRTRAFVNFYFKNPSAALTKMLDEEYVTSGAYQADMFPNINFIHTKNLNRNLYEFLLQNGYDKKDMEFILEKKKVLPLGKGRTKEQKWGKYYTPELKTEIRRKERVLFEIFPEFDV